MGDELGLGFVHATIINCEFIDNTATVGGAIFNRLSDVSLTACTFAGNSAVVAGGAMFSDVFSVNVMSNCILWGNEPDQVFDDISLTTVSYSSVEGGWPGIGNIDADPQFVDPDASDFRLSSGSPCIDAGVNNAMPPDTFDLDDDGDFGERVPLDLDLNPRFADDGSTLDTGCGVPVVIDMGAYEFPARAVDPIRVGDVDGDGIVGFADLLGVLASWGNDCGDCCLADVDYNGVVDFADLLSVIGAWG